MNPVQCNSGDDDHVDCEHGDRTGKFCGMGTGMELWGQGGDGENSRDGDKFLSPCHF